MGKTAVDREARTRTMQCAEADRSLYDLVLARANENYEQSFAWSKPEAGFDYHVVSLSRLAHAEAQIEVLEIFNCGQIGGFDNGQRAPRSIKTRLNWLKKHRRHRATASPDPTPKGEPKP